MTPESLPPPPRRVSRKQRGDLWLRRIFTLPHIFLGIGVAGYVVVVVLWRLLGTDVPARVTTTESIPLRKYGSSLMLDYQFQADGRMKSDSEEVNWDFYQRYQNLDESNPPVTVRYFCIGPFTYDSIYRHRSWWDQIGGPAVFAILWNLLISFSVYGVWVKPLRTRMLYQHGEATRGILLRKWARRTRASFVYFVSYSFQDPSSGHAFESRIQVQDREAWHMASEGQPVTILFSGDNPKRSTVYELDRYQVRDS